jgi:hypothetical protein
MTTEAWFISGCRQENSATFSEAAAAQVRQLPIQIACNRHNVNQTLSHMSLPYLNRSLYRPTHLPSLLDLGYLS